ncbi:MAG: hypothetical protein ACLGHC_06045 [Alphaproteobacteria bacterium]
MAAIERLEAGETLSGALPRPQTFAEGQRLIYGWLASAAGIFCGIMAVATIALLMWGGWSPAEEHTIVVILGCALGGFIAAMTSVIIGLLVGGPVGRFKGAAGRDGVSLEAHGDCQ